MPTPFTTIHAPKPAHDDAPEPRHRLLITPLYSNHQRLLLILMGLATTMMIIGCTTRGPQPLPMEVTGTSPMDSVLGVFYVLYLITWVIAG